MRIYGHQLPGRHTRSLEEDMTLRRLIYRTADREVEKVGSPQLLQIFSVTVSGNEAQRFLIQKSLTQRVLTVISPAG
jgi:hypothetical protein